MPDTDKANSNGEIGGIKLNWTKIVAWVMTTMFTLLLALCVFLFKSYANKIDILVDKANLIELKLTDAATTLQIQNTSTAGEISDLKETDKRHDEEIRELRK